MSETITVRRIADLDELEAAGGVWKDLQDRCEHPHVLMDHRWVLAWWRHFGAGKAQHTLVLSSGATPRGIVPLAITRGFEAYPFRNTYVLGPDDYRHLPELRWQRIVPVRRLTFPANVISGNIRGEIIFPEPDRSLYCALAEYAAEKSGSWDVATLPGLRGWEQEETMLTAAVESAGLTPGTRRSTRDMLYEDLPETWSEFLHARSRNFRDNLKRDAVKLERTFAALGPMKVTSYRGPEVVSNLDRLFALERQSWKVSDEKERRLHLALDDKTRSFFREVATRFSADDEANLLILSFGDTDAAGLFTLERSGTSIGVALYRSERLGSPITATPIFRALFENSISRGLKRIDFNGYTRHYLKWAKSSHTYTRAIFFNSSVYSRLLQIVDGSAVAFGRLISPQGKALAEQARTSS